MELIDDTQKETINGVEYAVLQFECDPNDPVYLQICEAAEVVGLSVEDYCSAALALYFKDKTEEDIKNDIISMLNKNKEEENDIISMLNKNKEEEND